MKTNNEYEINNENEIYTLHFMFSYKNILHIKSSWIHVMKHNISTYEETRNMIQDPFHKEEYIQAYLIISLNISESNRI